MDGRRRGTRMFPLVAGCLMVWICACYQLTATAAPAATAAQADDELIQKGRETVGQVCLGCHRNIVQMLQAEGRSADRWRTTVYSMISRGAHVMPDEIDALVAHLAGSYGPSGASPPAAAGNLSGPAAALPDAAGKSILEQSCAMCHDLGTAINKTAAEEWETVLDRMVTYGARVTPTDQEELIRYLDELTQTP